MPLQIHTIISSDPSENIRARAIVHSFGIRGLEGILETPFVLNKWPELLSRGARDCNGRTTCEGCSRITKTSQGKVYIILDGTGEAAVGAICTTSHLIKPFLPIYFEKPVMKK